MFAMVSSKNGISAREIERTYEVDTKTAWFMLHRIREAMKREPAALFSADPMVGTIAATRRSLAERTATATPPSATVPSPRPLFSRSSTRTLERFAPQVVANVDQGAMT